MEQKLQLHRISEPIKDEDKVIILQLTDVQLHTNARPTESIGGAMRRSIDNQKPVRLVSSIEKRDGSESYPEVMSLGPFLDMDDPSLEAFISEYKEKGYRVMLHVPKNGLPVFPGKDTSEFVNSVSGKRILRKIEKNKAKR